MPVMEFAIVWLTVYVVKASPLALPGEGGIWKMHQAANLTLCER